MTYTRLAGGLDHVSTVELCQPPNNFFSFQMIDELASRLEALDADDDCRVVVLAAEGKHFCAGADFSGPSTYTPDELYGAALRLFQTRKPIVAAVNGAAIGGGLGVALAADFRVVSPESRLSANFARLGLHHGFGLSVTLPDLVGQQRAAELLYTGRRINGEAAFAMGMADRLVATDELRTEAHTLAAEIAGSAPLAVESIRATLRAGLADRIQSATDHELIEQARLQKTDDFREGTAAMAARRPPRFTRR